MLSRWAPAVLALAVFAVAVGTSGTGWFEGERDETLVKALLGATVLIGVAVVMAAALWVIGAPWVRIEWLAAAALVLAAPVDVLAPAPEGTVHIAVVGLIDAAQITVGVSDGPWFAYQSVFVFPGGEGWVLPQWSFLQLVLGGASVFVVGRVWRRGVRERLLRLVFIGPPHDASRS
jgi:hypothetical protein